MQKELLIGGFNDPNVSYENYRLLADSGIDFVLINRGKKNSEQVFELLKYAEEFGVSVLIDVKESPERFGIEEFKKFKSFAGFHIFDEPITDDFQDIADKIKPFEDKFGKDKLFFVNLWTDQWDSCAKKLHATDYQNYIDRFCNEVLSKINGKRILSVDSYPLMLTENETDILDNRHLEVLEKIAESAKKFNAQSHLYIQTMGYGKYHRSPSLDDIRFQFFVGLAYGFKKFTHFCYYTPGGTCSDFDKKDYAMVYKDDTPSDIYYFAKEANAELKVLSKVFLPLEWERTRFIDGNNSFFEYLGKEYLRHGKGAIKGVKNISSEYESIIGEFNGKGKPAYVLVNFTNPCYGKTNTVSVEFDNINKVVLYYRDKTERLSLKDNKLIVYLRSGEGVIIVTE